MVVRGGFSPTKLRLISASRGVLGGEEAAGEGYAYATVVNGGCAHLAVKMVTHSWRNKAPCQKVLPFTLSYYLRTRVSPVGGSKLSKPCFLLLLLPVLLP